MCLTLKTTKTRRTKPFVAWKILSTSVRSSKLCSWYFTGKLWKERTFVKSNRKEKKLTTREVWRDQVYKGIHVYLKKPACNSFNVVRGGLVYPVVCDPKDFVASGYHSQAVFMKVFFGTMKEYKARKTK